MQDGTVIALGLLTGGNQPLPGTLGPVGGWAAIAVNSELKVSSQPVSISGPSTGAICRE